MLDNLIKLWSSNNVIGSSTKEFDHAACMYTCMVFINRLCYHKYIYACVALEGLRVIRLRVAIARRHLTCILNSPTLNYSPWHRERRNGEIITF